MVARRFPNSVDLELNENFWQLTNIAILQLTSYFLLQIKLFALKHRNPPTPHVRVTNTMQGRCQMPDTDGSGDYPVSSPPRVTEILTPPCLAKCTAHDTPVPMSSPSSVTEI